MKLSDREKTRLTSRYGQWAIVTGASSGIGLELATQLAEAGFNLVINARNLEKLKGVEKQLKAYSNIDIKIVVADVSETTGVDKIIGATQGLWCNLGFCYIL
jgi:short-subunit dehydrogenase